MPNHTSPQKYSASLFVWPVYQNVDVKLIGGYANALLVPQGSVLYCKKKYYNDIMRIIVRNPHTNSLTA